MNGDMVETVYLLWEVPSLADTVERRRHAVVRLGHAHRGQDHVQGGESPRGTLA
jgi:hypothetical protein